MKLFIFIGSVFSMVITSMLRGFVFQKFWSWFIIPIFNIPSISIAQSLGLMLIVGMITSGSNSEESKESETFVEKLFKATLTSVLMSILYLIFGFIVKSFI